MTTLLWLRRDLRLHDHAALATALEQPGAVQPVFVFDTDILARFTNPRDRRLGFIMGALVNIDRSLRQRGGGLLVLHGRAVEVIPALSAEVQASTICAAEDYEPATRARDAAVAKQLGGRFIRVIDHVLRAPYQVRKEDGTPFKVYTPYYKRWAASLTEADQAAFDRPDAGRYADYAAMCAHAAAAGLHRLPLEQGAEAALAALGYQYADDPLWNPLAGQSMLETFAGQAINHYSAARDMVARPGTSRLGPYVRHGLVSIRECYRAALAAPNHATWLKELCWREFYMMILYHWPEAVEQEFQPAYRGTIPWDRSERVRTALYEGRTGYPIIDAAIQELLQTGWMHNRARMIVASFFTKDLLMDWRIGEEFFAQHLMDYELASNNGGWQWSASTGTDAQPYFRVFNPYLQAEKFDPEGEYIRRYLPLLKDVPGKHIYAPHQSLYCPPDYPRPMVDHAEAKNRAVAVFRSANGK